MLNYSPDENNLNNVIDKLRPFTDDEGRKSRANATRLNAVSGVRLTFGVQNLNHIRNEKRHLQKRCIRKLAYDVCPVFQRPFACMNDPEIKQIYTRANKLFLQVFLLGLWTEHILKPIKLNTLQNNKVY